MALHQTPLFAPPQRVYYCKFCSKEFFCNFAFSSHFSKHKDLSDEEYLAGAPKRSKITMRILKARREGRFYDKRERKKRNPRGPNRNKGPKKGKDPTQSEVPAPARSEGSDPAQALSPEPLQAVYPVGANFVLPWWALTLTKGDEIPGQAKGYYRLFLRRDSDQLPPIAPTDPAMRALESGIRALALLEPKSEDGDHKPGLPDLNVPSTTKKECD